MTIAKILAPLTGGARDAAVLSTAFAAARPFNAHVEGLFVRPDPSEAVPFYGESVSPTVMQEVADASKKASDEALALCRASLAAAIEAAGAELLDTPALKDKPTASLREVSGNFADRVTVAARLCDLVVFGTLRENERPGLTEAFEATLLETGRPVLLSPQAASVTFCRKIAVAWNESVASAHAVTAALPYLKCAESVEVLSIIRSKDETIDNAELKSYLQLHGIAASERAIDAGTRSIGDALLEESANGGAGLLVAGGYGHSRLREMFFAGVTRHVVGHAEIPLFLVH